MATGIETRIYESLNARLNALVFSPVLPIAWDELARGFVPPATGFLVPHFMPATTTTFSIGFTGSNDYRGIYQIDVVWPEGKGIVVPMEKASAIAVHFKRGTVLYRELIAVRIDSPPYISPSLKPDPGWVRLPVNVPYYSYNLNP